MKNTEFVVQQVGLRALSTEGLAMLGADELAYIRPHNVNGETVYAVCGASGQELARFDNYATAVAACYENELEAVALQ